MADYIPTDSYWVRVVEDVLEQKFGVKFECQIWMDPKRYTKTLGIMIPLSDGTKYLFKEDHPLYNGTAQHTEQLVLLKEETLASITLLLG